MIELSSDRLSFSFPKVHPSAPMSINLQRTLRIPDDGKDYPLPPGLGSFPLRHVEDLPGKVPQRWINHGGVMFPMFQSEAMWINFNSTYDRERQVSYPVALKIATGKVCAVSGEQWKDGLRRNPQNYVVVPEQPWLDGYCVGKGTIRQFVAMPLGSGYSAEEQVTGKAEHGGIQIQAFPMKREVYKRRFPVKRVVREDDARYSMQEPCFMACDSAPDMGLAPGGRMKQEIYDDPYDPNDWDMAHSSRCFIHICNSMVWRSITGTPPPHPPPTAADYTRRGLPWFEYYNESLSNLDGTDVLKAMKSVVDMDDGAMPLPENEPTEPNHVVTYKKGLKPGQVTEWQEA